MREWATPQELAGKPGLPATERGVRMMASREGWVSRKREKGKGVEYAISSLPDLTQAHLAREHARKELSAARQAAQISLRRAMVDVAQDIAVEGLKKAAGLSGKPAARMQARMACVLAARQWLAQHGIADRDGAPGRKKCLMLFVAAWNTGAVNGVDAEREMLGEIDLSTLYRFMAAHRRRGLAALAGSYGHRRGRGQIDSNPKLRELAEWFCFEYPHAGPLRLVEIARQRLGVTLAESTARRWLQIYRRENEARILAVTNPDAWKDKYLPAFGDASAEAEHLNAIWELDSTPADVMLLDPDTGELLRGTIIGCIDVYSRRLRFLVARTGTAAGIASLLRRCILDWGVPDTVHTDNGQDYVSVHLQTFLSSLHIGQRLCAPFSPWEKPHIERAMRSMSHDLVELLPGFIGHNVTQRAQIEDRKAFAERLFRKGQTVEFHLSPAQLQDFLDRWCAAYEQRPHDGLNGLSPAIQAAQSAAAVKRVTDVRALDLLLYPVEKRRVISKKGIRHDNCLYTAPELGAHIGDEVLLRLDPEDQGRVVVFLARDGRFLCEAFDAQAAGVSRREVALAARRVGKQAAAAGRALARELRGQHNSKTLAQELLAARLADASNVAPLPRPAVPHHTEALAQARAALDGPATVRSTVDDKVVCLRQQQALDAGDFDRVAEISDPRKVHARWKRLEARVLAGEYVPDADRIALAQYLRSPECKSITETLEAFDLDWRQFAAE